MIDSRKVTDEVVAVSFNGPKEIYLRKSGKEFYGKEQKAVWFDGKTLVVDENVLTDFGIALEIK